MALQWYLMQDYQGHPKSFVNCCGTKKRFTPQVQGRKVAIQLPKQIQDGKSTHQNDFAYPSHRQAQIMHHLHLHKQPDLSKAGYNNLP